VTPAGMQAMAERTYGHPLQYALVGALAVYVGTAGAMTDDEIRAAVPGIGASAKVERYNRCPTCEQWSPCDVRTALDDAAARFAVVSPGTQDAPPGPLSASLSQDHTLSGGSGTTRPLSEADDARIRGEVEAFARNEGGWWCLDSPTTLRELAVELHGLGVPVDRALNILGRAVAAIANEYGE